MLALKKKNHRVNDQLKANADFKQAVETDWFVFFGGGLKRYIRNATLCSAKPPESVMELLSAAKIIELQSEARDKLFELEELSEVDKAEIGYITSKPINKTINNDLQMKEIDCLLYTSPSPRDRG